ncbi:MAG: TfoX/Sxy family protein [Burkholderiaceae bacterium]|nr:TfoX/Sxy family protein [Burkholderiaceae bacterium]
MAFDPGLAQRIREALGERTDLSERRMFGGIAFMVADHMAVGIVGDVLMVRVGPQRYAQALQQPFVRPMDFTGKPLTGYVYVDPPGIAEDAALAAWVAAGAGFAATLPPKTKAAARRPRPPAR